MDKQLNERDKRRISLIFALLCCVGFFNYMIHQLFLIGGMVISITLIGVAMVFSYKTMMKIKFPAVALALAIIVGLYYSITRQVSATTLFGKEFAFYFCMCSILAMYQADTEKLFRYVSYISLLLLPFYNDIFIEMNSTRANNSISMGLSYGIFPLLMAPLYHMFFYRKEGRAHMYIVYGVALFLLVNLVFKGNRGILLSLVVGLSLVYIKGGENAKRNGFSIARTCVIMVVAAIIIIYFYDIIAWLNDLFDKWNIEAHFLDKILSLEKTGDVSNGREIIFGYTLEEIFKRPLFGHGLSTLFYNSAGRFVYPHNFILQLFYDGGFVLAVPVLIVIGRAIYYAIAGKNREEAIFSLFLVTISLPRAMFSADIWENSFFWLLVMHSLKYHNLKEERQEEKDVEEFEKKRKLAMAESGVLARGDDSVVSENTENQSDSMEGIKEV